MGECHHEMPGLPYPAFRMVNAEPGGGKPSPYTRSRRRGRPRACPPRRRGRLPGTHKGCPYVVARPGWPWHDLVAAPAAAALPGSAAMYTEGAASRPRTAKGLADIGVQENKICTLGVAQGGRAATKYVIPSRGWKQATFTAGATRFWSAVAAATAFRPWFIRELCKSQNKSGSCCDRTPKALRARSHHDAS
jgi:hypothetical protein